MKGGPEGKGAAKRVKVGYGSGDRLEVKVDGGVVRHACARVQSMCTCRAGGGARGGGVHELEVTVDGGVVRHARIADSPWP